MHPPQHHRKNLQLITIALLGYAHITLADLPSGQQQEVQHLLAFVGNSHCTVIRNGEPHTGKEARQHIEKKYDYLRKKIKTTEAFIELSASRSSLSGNEYQARCPGQPSVKSGTWLKQELMHYRQRSTALINP